MKKALILLSVLTLVVITGVLISEASGAGIQRTQEMSVDGVKPIPEPEPCLPPNCVPGPMPYPDPVPGPKPDPYAPSPWVTAVSNPNFEARIQYINGLWYGELRDKRTGEIVLYVPLPDGNNTHIYDVSPDGSTVFYDLGDTTYAQRITGKQERISTKGKLKSISFEGQYALVNISNPDGSFVVLKVNLVTGEAVYLGTGVDGPKPSPDPVIDPGRGTGIDSPLPPME